MAKSLEVLQKRIAKLQAEADAIRAKEAVGVISRIREAISHYGLTVEHLFGGNGVKAVKSRAPKVRRAKRAGARPARKTSPIKGTKAPIKYRDNSGNTWSGRGSQPRWLRAAIASGKKIEDFSAKS
jgi:DNA-binding protein H-NS